MPNVEMVDRARRLGQRLVQGRQDRGWSQRRAALEIGTDQATLSKYEDGTRLPPLITLMKAAECFGRPVGWFFEEIDEDVRADLLGSLDSSVAGWFRRYPSQYQRWAIAHLEEVDRFCREYVAAQSKRDES